MPPKRVKSSSKSANNVAQPKSNVKSIKYNMQEIRNSLEYRAPVEAQIVYLSPEKRRTSEIMTKFEYTKVVADRAEQIKNGSVCFTDVEGLSDPIEMAKKEVHDKKCPLDIRRMITDKIAERWHVNEMAIPPDV